MCEWVRVTVQRQHTGLQGLGVWASLRGKSQQVWSLFAQLCMVL